MNKMDAIAQASRDKPEGIYPQPQSYQAKGNPVRQYDAAVFPSRG